MLSEFEVPVAYSMVKLASSASPDYRPFQEFMCYWTAFNNIYTTLAESSGHRNQLRIEGGMIKTLPNGSVNIPEVKPVRTERREIEHALHDFSKRLKQSLITHQSTKFFAERTPRWRGRQIEHDASGQRLNGVLNVGYTVNDQYPVWSPIDTAAFDWYLQETPNEGDASDREVIEKALPLLKMIVEEFVDPLGRFASAGRA